MYTRIVLGALLQQWHLSGVNAETVQTSVANKEKAQPPVLNAQTVQTSDGRVAFITDLEGNLDFLERCFRNHPFIKLKTHRTKPGYKQLDWINDNGKDQFVYGGDLTDRFHQNIRVGEAVVDFKERYPDRVHLVLGNRDRRKIQSTYDWVTNSNEPWSKHVKHRKKIFETDGTSRRGDVGPRD